MVLRRGLQARPGARQGWAGRPLPPGARGAGLREGRGCQMKPRVLAVDDDERNLALLTAKLDREGYEIETAKNGLEALQKATAFNPDLIIMDVMMPRMDGYEALRHLKSREETRYIPVIMRSEEHTS